MVTQIMLGANDISKMAAQDGDSRNRARRGPFRSGDPATAGNGVLIGFRGPSRQAVRSAWKTALRNGGTDAGAPGDRPLYSEDFHAAYLRDP